MGSTIRFSYTPNINLESKIICQIDAYRKLKPTQFSPEEKEKLINHFTYHSNKIEGLKLSYGDTIEYLKTGLISSSAPLKDLADLANHKEVLKSIFEQYNSFTLSKDTILEFHKILMKDAVQWREKDIYNDQAGVFKKTNNFGIRENGQFKEYMSWIEVPKAIEKLCSQTNQLVAKKPLYAILNFHYLFANEIHPFWDGNGRMARLLTNLLLLQNELPLINIEESEKHNYLRSLINQEKNPKAEQFYHFMLRKISEAINNKLRNFAPEN